MGPNVCLRTLFSDKMTCGAPSPVCPYATRQANVRFVFHFSMPKSLTHYYQESGRAGRDGRPADCVVYFSYNDKRKLEWMLRKSASELGASSGRSRIGARFHACPPFGAASRRQRQATARVCGCHVGATAHAQRATSTTDTATNGH